MHLTTDYNRFEADIKGLKYTTDDGVVYPKTAIVTFFNENTLKKEVELMGYMDEEDIFKKIDNKEALDLSHCYINHLSLANYRQSRGMNNKEYVEIYGFKACKSLFDSLIEFDFSYAHFEDSFDIENTQFAGKDLKLDFHNAIFNGKKINFSYVYFNDGGVDFSGVKFNGAAIFKNSIFGNGNVDFQDAEFGEGQVSFVNTEFNNGDVSFINTNFGPGNVSFKVARFGEGKIDFHFAKFGEGDISFERTEFGNGRVDFRAVEFNAGKMNFNRSIFGSGEVSFEGSSMKGGRFYFKRAEFGEGNISFQLIEYENTEFILDNTSFGKGELSFYNGKTKSLSLKSCHLNAYLDLRLASCGFLDLSDTIVRDIIDLTPFEFEVGTKSFNLTGMKLLGRVYIDWHLNHCEKIIKAQKDTSFHDKAEQFRILKQNFNLTGQYTDEDSAYIEFKRFESKAKLNEDKKAKMGFLYAYPLYYLKMLIFDKVGLYATNPMRVLASMVVIFLIYSLLYFLLPLISSGRINSFMEVSFSLDYFKECMYYSGVTFFTIGYGDISPIGLFRAVAIIEGFTGVFIMSYFTVAFVRNILR